MNFKLIFLIIMTLSVFTFGSYANKTEGIVAVINDDVIFLSELEDHIKKSGANSLKKKIKKKYLTELIDLKLLELQGRKLGIFVTDELLDSIEEDFVKRNTREALDKETERTGINLYRIRFSWRNQYLQEAISNVVLRNKIALTDKEILNYYVKNYSQINKESLANVTLIIINELESSEEKISKLRSLESNEASFNSLILEYKKNKIISEESGNLGYLNPIDLGAEIGDAIQSASLNSLIGPFSYNGSSRYFYVKDKVYSDPDFLKAKDEIREILFEEKRFLVLDDWFQGLRDGAYISERL